MDRTREEAEAGAAFDPKLIEPYIIKDPQALLHQHVVVGNVPGGRLERLDAGFFREGDPDFRNQYAFQVETRDFHRPLLG